MKVARATSNHYARSRHRREKFISRHINGDGNIIDEFIVDRKHKDGKEIHKVTDTGLIIVYNYNTGKLVTKLIARPNQIKRYYKDVDKEPPVWLIALAQWHVDLNYNA